MNVGIFWHLVSDVSQCQCLLVKFHIYLIQSLYLSFDLHTECPLSVLTSRLLVSDECPLLADSGNSNVNFVIGLLSVRFRLKADVQYSITLIYFLLPAVAIYLGGYAKLCLARTWPLSAHRYTKNEDTSVSLHYLNNYNAANPNVMCQNVKPANYHIYNQHDPWWFHTTGFVN